jgi:hypothetical protein
MILRWAPLQQRCAWDAPEVPTVDTSSPLRCSQIPVVSPAPRCRADDQRLPSTGLVADAAYWFGPNHADADSDAPAFSIPQVRVGQLRHANGALSGTPTECTGGHVQQHRDPRERWPVDDIAVRVLDRREPADPGSATLS